jgi:hypothetical protein
MRSEACVDKSLLVSYLYDECEPDEQRVIAAHLRGCTACHRELEALRQVRVQLAGWIPPERASGFVVGQKTTFAGRWWRQVPVWARAAAALLAIAAAAAVAHLEVRYGAEGLVVRTGLRSMAQASAAMVAPSARPNAAGDAPWRGDFASLEEKMRTELAATRAALNTRAEPVRVPVRQVDSGMSDSEMLRRVRALIDESEKRQQQELALRLTQMLQEVNAQRRADLVRIQQGFGQLQGRTGAAIADQREMLNYLIRASQTGVVVPSRVR